MRGRKSSERQLRYLEELDEQDLGEWLARDIGAGDAAVYAKLRAFRKPIAVAHLYSFYGLVVVTHGAAVIITELKEAGSSISALFTG